MMKSELSPQLAARLGPGPANDGGPRGRGRPSLDQSMLVPGAGAGRGGSDYSKLRGIIRTQKDQVQALENEVAHFQTRLHRIEDGHRLELARLKKEVEYHKRLRQGADQRSYELEDRLARVQREAAAAHHTSHDEEKDSLIVQSQLLVSKNSELTYKLKTMEAQVSQLEELKAALESELNQAYCERDELAAELEHILSRQHQQHSRDPDADGEDGFDDGAEAAAASGPEGGAGGPGSSEEQ